MDGNKTGPMIWGALLHLGSNMWDDYESDPDGWAKSPEEEAVRPNPYGPGKKRRSSYHSYVICRDDLWRKSADHLAAAGMNTVFVDVGEALFYPSHPELAVKGTWSVVKMEREVARLRKLGLEPIPKLNFSSVHDGWLKWYHRQLSTPEYYAVVRDVIRDTCRVFGNPRLFHIGYDEEMPIASFNHFFTICRQGELWWHDFLFTVNEVERNGARAVCWSDKLWTGKDEFLKRMPKSVLQCNWYYRSDFGERKLKWNPDFERKGGWGETVHGAASFAVLEKAGYDQLPCTSNWAEDASADAVVGYCREHIDPGRLKGFITAPWKMSVPDRADRKNISATLSGIDLLRAARTRHYGS